MGKQIMQDAYAIRADTVYNSESVQVPPMPNCAHFVFFLHNSLCWHHHCNFHHRSGYNLFILFQIWMGMNNIVDNWPV